MFGMQFWYWIRRAHDFIIDIAYGEIDLPKNTSQSIYNQLHFMYCKCISHNNNFPDLRQVLKQMKYSPWGKDWSWLWHVLHTAYHRAFKFVQTTLGVDMWRQGSSQKLSKTLNLLGLCLSADATRNHVDRLSHMCDHSILTWKAEIKVSSCNFVNCKYIFLHTMLLNSWMSFKMS